MIVEVCGFDGTACTDPEGCTSRAPWCAREHHRDVAEGRVCDHPDCGMTFGDRRALSAHRRIHTPRLPCPEACGRSFEARAMVRHRRESHGVEPVSAVRVRSRAVVRPEKAPVVPVEAPEPVAAPVAADGTVRPLSDHERAEAIVAAARARRAARTSGAWRAPGQ